MERRSCILIVDDENFSITVLGNLLQPYYDTMIAKSGPQALRSAQSATPPDLILLDIMMPGMDGYEVCRRLKADAATSAIPVMFVSSMDAVGDEIHGLELGAVDYISKPFSPAVVLARVKTHLAMTAMQKELLRQNTALLAADRLQADIERITRHDLKSPVANIVGFADLILETRK